MRTASASRAGETFSSGESGNRGGAAGGVDGGVHGGVHGEVYGGVDVDGVGRGGVGSVTRDTPGSVTRDNPSSAIRDNPSSATRNTPDSATRNSPTSGPRSMTGSLAPSTRDSSGQVRVLVVDDEASLAELLCMALRYEGWQARSAGDGAAAVRVAHDFRPDAVVLDVMLPDMDGLAVLRRVRADLPEVPVLFLTARDAVEDRIAGLTAGGDDYVTKPFSLEEVVARLRGLIRRTGGGVVARPDSELVVGDLRLDEDSHEVWRGEEEVRLTATEFELLRFLMRNPRRVLSKAQILDRVWHYDFGGQANVVELYISYLRKKIDAGRTPMIHTRRGAGYLIKPGG